MDDVRTFQKIGQTLLQIPQIQLVFFGNQPAHHTPNFAEKKYRIRLETYKVRPGRLWDRLGSIFKYCKILLQERPHLILVSSPDLLLVTSIFKIFYGFEYLYDVQENYWVNIINSKTYTPFQRKIVHRCWRLFEHAPQAMVDGYVLAESCYAQELSFLKHPPILNATFAPSIASDKQEQKPVIVAQNKYAGPLHNRVTPIAGSDVWQGTPTLCITGTIGPRYGIVEAIKFSITLNKYKPHLLKILGYSASTKYSRIVKKLAFSHDHVMLNSLDTYVAYPEIEEAIAEADMMLMPYQLGVGLDHRMPTKLFTYMAKAKPILMSPNPLWMEFARPFQAALPFDFHQRQNQDIPQLVENISSHLFYTKPPDETLLWGSEEQGLLDFFRLHLHQENND